MYLVALPVIHIQFDNFKRQRYMTRVTMILFGVFMCVNYLFASSYDGDIQSMTVNYYSQNIDIQYNSNMVIETRSCIKIHCLEEFRGQLEQTDYQTLLDNLEEHRAELKLNDWLFYELMYATVADLLSTKDENTRTMTVAFLMAKSGYDVRMTTVGLKHLFLYVKTKDMVYGVPIIRPDRETFINVTSFKSKITMGGKWMNDTELYWNKGGKGMNMKLSHIPEFKGNIIKKTIKFTYNEKEYHINTQVNHSIKEMMVDYPRVDEIVYVQTPLSQYSKRMLLPQLRAHLSRLNQKESLEFLAAFTRSFEYKWDHDFSDVNLPMIADEVLMSDFSDHEDRVALYYQLVVELLDLPMLVLSYLDETKMTIAVASDEPYGKQIDYAGVQYYICDPTSPNNSHAIGKFPTAFSTSDVEVVGTFKDH